NRRPQVHVEGTEAKRVCQTLDVDGCGHLEPGYHGKRGFKLIAHCFDFSSCSWARTSSSASSGVVPSSGGVSNLARATVACATVVAIFRASSVATWTAAFTAASRTSL